MPKGQFQSSNLIVRHIVQSSPTLEFENQLGVKKELGNVEFEERRRIG